MSRRRNRNYTELKHSVDNLTNVKPRMLPFKFNYVSDNVDSVLKEEIVYVIGIFIIINLMLIFTSPDYIKEKYINRYGILENKINYKKLLKWSIFFTATITISMVIYNNQ